MSAEVFDELVEVYDALIDWPKRLAHEEAFYRQLFEQHKVRRVLDVACGTGRHAALFHAWGLHVEGADLSPAMIARCRDEFGDAESLRWAVRGFDEPHGAAGKFDAVICVGNSLALAADEAVVERAVRVMLDAVRPGGVCIVQVLNLWHLPDGPTVWQKCKRVAIGGHAHIVVKGVHRAGGRGFVDLVDLTLAADGVEPRYESPAFLGLKADQLVRTAENAGAKRVQCYGDVQFAAYDRSQSTDLIVVAAK